MLIFDDPFNGKSARGVLFGSLHRKGIACGHDLDQPVIDRPALAGLGRGKLKAENAAVTVLVRF